MKGLARLSLFLPLVSAFAFSRPESQQVLHTTSLDNSDVELYHLLAVHNDDPVEVMRLVDPVHAADLDEPRLLQVFGFDPIWMTEGDKLRLRMQGLSFMDLTGREDLSRPRVASEQDPTWPEVQHQERVKEVIKGLNINEMKYNLGNLTSLYNRYYRSENGEKASTWVHDKVLEIVAEAPSNVRVSIESFSHSYPQSSIIARFEPATPLNDQARVIVGAHLDSVNQIFPYLRAPGADDDGSGTVTTLEAFRALVQAGFTPELPVEFHWYAAEEGGLLGSQDVVKEYVKRQKQVAAMIQFDMTAYVPAGATPNVTFITTDVDIPLTTWAVEMAAEYSSSPVVEARLFPGAGSDHMSWNRAGFPAVFATEGDPYHSINPYIHTTNDRMDLKNGEFSFEHAFEYSKVAIGFVVELGGWAN